MANLQFEALGQRLAKIEEMMERLERRLWLAVYGVVAAIVAGVPAAPGGDAVRRVRPEEG